MDSGLYFLNSNFFKKEVDLLFLEYTGYERGFQFRHERLRGQIAVP